MDLDYLQIYICSSHMCMYNIHSNQMNVLYNLNFHLRLYQYLYCYFWLGLTFHLALSHLELKFNRNTVGHLKVILFVLASLQKLTFLISFIIELLLFMGAFLGWLLAFIHHFVYLHSIIMTLDIIINFVILLDFLILIIIVKKNK